MQDTIPIEGRRRSRARACATALAATALAVGAGACGSDDGDPNPGQAKSNEPAAAKPLTGNDKQQIRQLVKNVQTYYTEGDATNYCASLTAGGRKLVAKVGRPYGMNDCQTFVTRTSRLTREAKVKQKPTVLLRVRVRGDRAVATVSDGGREAQPVGLVKIDGEWKIPDPGIRDPLAPVKQTTAGQAGTTQ